jgi:RNase adapter protein RapZ
MNQLNNFENKQSRQILLVTGLSGAGKNIVMRALEDLGFYCVDNLPVPLISKFLDFTFQSPQNSLKVALSVDSRADGFSQNLMQEIKKLKNAKDNCYQLKIIFLNSSNKTLLRRYQETRRKHPLGKDESVENAILQEKKLLSPFIKLSDIVLDTDTFNVHQLRAWVNDSFLENSKKEILVNLVSFGFKYGVPSESNLVYDLRFLPNPYFVPALKILDGRQGEVQSYLFGHPVTIDYWYRLKDFLSYSIQKYFQEGRFFVNVAIGCTGGRHRSVAFVEKIGKENWENVKFLVHHRDVEKDLKK